MKGKSEILSLLYLDLNEGLCASNHQNSSFEVISLESR